VTGSTLSYKHAVNIYIQPILQAAYRSPLAPVPRRGRAPNRHGSTLALYLDIQCRCLRYTGIRVTTRRGPTGIEERKSTRLCL